MVRFPFSRLRLNYKRTSQRVLVFDPEVRGQQSTVLISDGSEIFDAFTCDCSRSASQFECSRWFQFYFADNYLNFIWHTSSDKPRFSAIHS